MYYQMRESPEKPSRRGVFGRLLFSETWLDEAAWA